MTEASPLPPEPFADELPPDFWGDALEPPALLSTPSPTTLQTDPDERFEPTAASSGASASPQSTAKPLSGTLKNDPRFVLLTELFPGRISDWQSAEPVAAADGEDEGAGAADAAAEPETVDLEAGLDADENADDVD